jgi:hypothetical protein
MKRNLALVAFVAVMLSGFAFAGIGTHFDVKIPFAFYIEDQLLPAGEYDFEMGGSAIVIRAKDGTGVRLLATMSGANEKNTEDFLRFHRYGDKHFLSNVAIGGHKANVKIAKTEREVRNRIEKAREVILAANE